MQKSFYFCDLFSSRWSLPAALDGRRNFRMETKTSNNFGDFLQCGERWDIFPISRHIWYILEWRGRFRLVALHKKGAAAREIFLVIIDVLVGWA